MSFRLNITGFKSDKIKITQEEFKLVNNGKNLKWLDTSMIHVWPSMSKGEGHICSFELERVEEFYESKEMI